jgi:flagellar protein FliS
MISNGYNNYRKTIVNTTSNKEEVLLLLYEKALFCLKMARRGIVDRNVKQRGENLSKVLAILTEFDCALDREKGGDLADSLAGIYHYAMDRLTVANIKNDPEAIKEVERLLGELYDGFKDAARQAADSAAFHRQPTPASAGGGMRLAV